jgi:tRNA (cytidine/uridine-2'-O-)-methyltransferase
MLAATPTSAVAPPSPPSPPASKFSCRRLPACFSTRYSAPFMKKNEQMRHSERKRIELEFDWAILNIVLVEPSIPPNTGNISRLCAATGARLHLVEPIGFDISEKQVRRAGLDYWDAVDLTTYPDFDSFVEKNPAGNKYFFSTAGHQSYSEVEYTPGDYLIFGNETLGLPDSLLKTHPEQVCNIPIKLDAVRSLNLSNCASIVLYEALRQINT